MIPLALFLFLLYPQLITYYYSVTRFNPVQRLLLSMHWDIVENALISVFSLTNNGVLNASFIAIILIGFLSISSSTAIPLLIRKQEYNQSRPSFLKRIINYFSNRTRLTALSLTLSFILLLAVTVIYYSFSYEIIDGTLIIIPKSIGARFLIGPHLYLSWLFIYSLSKLGEYLLMLVLVLSRNIKGGSKLVKLLSRDRNRKVIYIVIFMIFVSPFSYYTWTEGFASSITAGQLMGLYKVTSQWLASNLDESEIAIVPLEAVFLLSSSDLRGKTVSYKFFWDKAGVTLRADNTIEEYYLVQDQLLNFIKENNSLEYLVVDWMDDYCKPLFQSSLGIQNELAPYLKKVHEESFTLPNQWTARIEIYKVVTPLYP